MRVTAFVSSGRNDRGAAPQAFATQRRGALRKFRRWRALNAMLDASPGRDWRRSRSRRSDLPQAGAATRRSYRAPPRCRRPTRHEQPHAPPSPVRTFRAREPLSAPPCRLQGELVFARADAPPSLARLTLEWLCPRHLGDNAAADARCAWRDGSTPRIGAWRAC